MLPCPTYVKASSLHLLRFIAFGLLRFIALHVKLWGTEGVQKVGITRILWPPYYKLVAPFYIPSLCRPKVSIEVCTAQQIYKESNKESKNGFLFAWLCCANFCTPSILVLRDCFYVGSTSKARKSQGVQKVGVRRGTEGVQKFVASSNKLLVRTGVPSKVSPLLLAIPVRTSNPYLLVTQSKKQVEELLLRPTNLLLYKLFQKPSVPQSFTFGQRSKW